MESQLLCSLRSTLRMSLYMPKMWGPAKTTRVEKTNNRSSSSSNLGIKVAIFPVAAAAAEAEDAEANETIRKRKGVERTTNNLIKAMNSCNMFKS